MLESGELNISEITRRSGLSHTSAAHHLEFLTTSGILTEKRFNRIRIFRLEYTNPMVGALNRFFSEWKSLRDSPLQSPFS
jgi:DNA-binding transcriptional ArsR family regulator